MRKSDKSPRVAMLCDSPGLVVPRSRHLEILPCLDSAEDAAHVLYQLLGIVRGVRARSARNLITLRFEFLTNIVECYGNTQLALRA